MTDSSGNTRSVPVEINLEDVNEFRPVTQTTLYRVTMPEGTAQHTGVLSLTSTDGDYGPVFGRITYQMGPPGNTWFYLSQDGSGAAQMYVNTPPDLEQIPGGVLQFPVYAIDGGNLDAIATVEVVITPVNEFTPVFQYSIYDFAVRYDAPVGYSVGRIDATDEDAGKSPVRIILLSIPFL